MTFETAVATNFLATILVTLTYIYLFVQYRQAYMAKWAIGWAIAVVRQIFLDGQFAVCSQVWEYIISFGVMSCAYSLLMVLGTMEFAGKKTSGRWFIVGLGCLLVSCAAIFSDLPFEFFGLPTIAYMSSIYIVTGVTFWRIPGSVLGKYVTGSAFILLGIHLFDMPIFFRDEVIAPWGFLIDGILKFLVAVGVVLVYFEKANNELERYYCLLAENATDVIYRYRLAPPVGFEYISPAIEQLTGYPLGKFKHLSDIMRIVNREDLAQFKESVRKGDQSDGGIIIRLTHKSGETVWTEHNYAVIAEERDTRYAVEGIIRDVTKRVTLEQEMARFDRLNIVGQMAANLAHEIRNPLTTVRGYIQLLGNKAEFRGYKAQLAMLLDELDRTNAILREYLALSKNKIIEIKSCDLNEIIKSLYPLIQASAVAYAVEVRLKLSKIPRLQLDEKEIKQLILNLTRNALEAMADGGILTMETNAGQNTTTLLVKDTGKGIPQNVLDNLGKPFLTTKEDGTGLGIAICYRIVNRHHAKLDVETGPAGTAIIVKFQNG
jgi:PAS domain S-box-containing protein